MQYLCFVNATATSSSILLLSIESFRKKKVKTFWIENELKPNEMINVDSERCLRQEPDQNRSVPILDVDLGVTVSCHTSHYYRK
mmetsp:Transcript_22214/g.31102  ORF Transcript_22214/g.31102 Transcript_22214/m.31102 type:complete len:84 (+) Transcript_22214:445-696(+)